MSFVHNVRVGFFGFPEESSPARELQADECLDLLQRYNANMPESLQVRVELPARPAVRGSQTIGIADNWPIVLRSGFLTCPYLAMGYIPSGVGFAAFVQKALGCSIYSDDDGRVLSLEEFIPAESFSSIMESVKRLPSQSVGHVA